MRIPSPFTSAWFRYLAIIFGLLRYLAASKARALRIGQLLCSYFPFAFSPSSTSRPLFRWLFRLVMACTDRFSFRAIDGLSRPDASNVKSCASSAGVHGRPVGRGPSFIWLSPSAPTLQAGDLARFRWRAPWPRGKGADVRVSLISFPVRLHFRRLMIRLNVPVSMKGKADKPDRHKDGSGHHHPMGIEQQVEQFG